MSRGRFGLLARGARDRRGHGVTFVGVLTLIEDETTRCRAPPPRRPPRPPARPRRCPARLATPTFVAIVSSDADEATAQQRRDELTESGYDSDVLHSDDFTSLEPGFWVAYVGPFPDPAAAQAAVDQLVADGYTSAYPRCIGTAEEC